MNLKPQSKSKEMRRAQAHDFYAISWRLMTSVVPRHICGWGAKHE
jgi:hypothetical protein